MTDREICLSNCKCKNIREFDCEQVTWNLDLLVHRNKGFLILLKCPERCPTCLRVSGAALGSQSVSISICLFLKYNIFTRSGTNGLDMGVPGTGSVPSDQRVSERRQRPGGSAGWRPDDGS
jgi:hypothetical protein